MGPLTQDRVCSVCNELWLHRKVDTVKAIDIAAQRAFFCLRKLGVERGRTLLGLQALEAVPKAASWNTELSRSCGDRGTRKFLQVAHRFLNPGLHLDSDKRLDLVVKWLF